MRLLPPPNSFQELYCWIITTGFVMGLGVGLVVGLSRSPVAGAAVTGLLSAAMAAVALTGNDSAILFVRWRYFSCFAAPFGAAFLIAVGGGMYVRALQPSPADLFVKRLQTLGYDPQKIAAALAATVEKSGGPAAWFDGALVLYSSEGGGVPSSASAPALPSPAACTAVSPPLSGGYTDAFIQGFDKQGGKLKELAEFVTKRPPSERLQMLRGGYFALCGR